MSYGLTTAEMADNLRAHITIWGGLRKWCRQHRITPSLVNKFLNHGGPCPPKLAAAMGYRRIVRYVPTKEAPND